MRALDVCDSDGRTAAQHCNSQSLILQSIIVCTFTKLSFIRTRSAAYKKMELMKHAAIRVRAIDSANIQSGVSELY